MARTTTLTSTLGDTLLFANMTANERLGRLFAYELQAISRNAEIDLRALLGTPMTAKYVSRKGYTRYFNGIVSEAAQSGFVSVENVRYAQYDFTIVPKPWLLTRRRDCRIYRNMSVPQIVSQLLNEIGYGDLKQSLTGNYAKREYCVQYRESDFDFMSRLMEQEGIYYFFTHTEHAHTMVLADSLGAHAAVPGFEQIPYAPQIAHSNRTRASIGNWCVERTTNPTKVQLDDYDYLKPRASLLATEEVTDTADAHRISGLDIYDYAYGTYGYDQQIADGQRWARVRADALNVPQAVSSGNTDASGLATGALFRLTDFPVAQVNQEYLVVETDIRVFEPGYISGETETRQPFECDFKAIRSRQPFRAMPTTPRPTIAGLQTAVVYGDTPEDIAVDKYGRVQVTFFWNQPGKPNAQNSCPVRVAQMWAGKRWGAQFLPRVGQEVVVSFLDGDPDRPLIIGSVYNADNMPPYSLPDSKTQSGVKSRSLQGGPEASNEVRFEDKPGAEQLLIHAQKDLREEAENNHDVDVTRNYTLTAGEQIELVTGLASIVLKSTGEIAIKGTSLEIEGLLDVALKAGLSMELGAKGKLSVGALGAMEIVSGLDMQVQSQALTLAGTLSALLTGMAMLMPGPVPPMPVPGVV
jgi:type VI secretion system secreted protein VgrG